MLDSTHALGEELLGRERMAELLAVDLFAEPESREAASARRRAELVAAYGPGVIG